MTMDSHDFPDLTPKRTARQPLLGLTIMLVEDSRFCSEAIRLMSLRSGARLRRADSLHAAHQHLKIYRPNVAMVDIGLPDGSGLDIIRELHASSEVTPPVLAISGDDSDAIRSEALAAGAAAFLAKPLKDLAAFQQAILGQLPDDGKAPRFTPRLVGVEVEPDTETLREDLEHVQAIMLQAIPAQDQTAMAYCAQLLEGVAQLAKDADLIALTQKLRTRLADGHLARGDADLTLRAVQSRLTA